jgi:serine/threonine protein kinase
MLERAVELSLALEYLHHDVAGGAGTSFIVHRDLKPDNGMQTAHLTVESTLALYLLLRHRLLCHLYTGALSQLRTVIVR